MGQVPARQALDWLDPPIGDMLPSAMKVVAPLVPSVAAGMIGDMSLAGQVTLPASRSVRTLLVKWPWGGAGAGVNIGGRGDPAAGQLAPWIRDVTITNGLAAGGDQRSWLRAVQVAAATDGSDGQPKPTEHDG